MEQAQLAWVVVCDGSSSLSADLPYSKRNSCLTHKMATETVFRSLVILLTLEVSNIHCYFLCSGPLPTTSRNER